MTRWESQGRFRQNGKTPAYRNAANHWKMWREDFQLLQALNINAYRFSMDWGRIEPAPNCFDETALAQYDEMVDELLELNIIPMLTLHHFTHPIWFHQNTPWHTPDAVEAFAKFAGKLIERFSGRIRLYVTFNEPMVWALAAYGDGKFPPGQKNMPRMMKALANILKAHQITYGLIKSRSPESLVGIAKNFVIFNPQRRYNPLDIGLTRRIHTFYNSMLPDSFKSNQLRFHLPGLLKFNERIELNNQIDFWGLNYYYRLHVRFRMKPQLPFELNSIHRSGEGMSDLDWEVYSPGLEEILGWLKSTNKPVIITENGIADSQDKSRTQFLKSHLAIVEKARQSGYPLLGYFHWSFMDNYEWLEGHSARFGLHEVDYANGYHRRLRDSGRFYADHIANHSFESTHRHHTVI